MKLINYREGFACNSSSTHSIIFSGRKRKDRDAESGEFGWEHFIAASPEAKRKWLATTIRYSLPAGLSRDVVRLVIESICGPIEEGWENWSIDHQSSIQLPLAWDGLGLDMQFAREFHHWLMSLSALIYGGNDNDGDDGDTPPTGHRVFYRKTLPTDTCNAQVARKDSSGYWTVFDRQEGNKTRFMFEAKDLPDVEAKQADAPELVDLKITDFCTYGCSVCYQGSTKQGKHGDFYTIEAVLEALARARVFEVAIGGGEPTLHPRFTEILQAARGYGIAPNFTTRDPEWFLRHMHSIEAIGSYAVSCDSQTAVQRAVQAVEALPLRERTILRSKLTVQHILGIADEWEVSSILRECDKSKVPLVLLGYKTTHRGANTKPKVPRGGETWGAWLAEKMTVDGDDDGSSSDVPYRLGVDTVLAGELVGLVPDYRLTVKEGQFSCYVDATGSKPYLYASSFDTGEGYELDLQTYPKRVDNLLQTWRKLTAYSPKSAYIYKKDLLILPESE